jgi:hypothetical protein
MIQGFSAPRGLVSFGRHRVNREIFSLAVLGSSALALNLFTSGWMPHARPVAANVAEAPAAATAPTVASYHYGAPLVELGSRSRPASVSLAQSSPPEMVALLPPAPAAAIPEPRTVQPKSIATADQFGESAPLPPRRPDGLGLSASRVPPQAPLRHLALQNRTAVAPPAPADNRTFFEKIFGASEPSAPQASGPKPSGPALAYAVPGTDTLGGARSVAPGPSPRFDRGTAVYDISAHTVYMPNGTRLEAHSGLRDRLDDPRYVHERMRGATPPHVYELTPRERLFHGVQALRLNPVGGGGQIFGRAGLLAHTYMLGPNGDSNGCVSFRNYDAFLQAYKNGEVKRLVVVARLN